MKLLNLLEFLLGCGPVAYCLVDTSEPVMSIRLSGVQLQCTLQRSYGFLILLLADSDGTHVDIGNPSVVSRLHCLMQIREGLLRLVSPHAGVAKICRGL